MGNSGNIYQIHILTISSLLRIDNNSSTGQYRHFARVLVEIDLAHPMQEQVMLERTGHCGFVSITYERLTAFCPHCTMLRHSSADCKRQRKMEKEGQKDKESTVDNKHGLNRPNEKQIYRQKFDPKVLHMMSENDSEHADHAAVMGFNASPDASLALIPVKSLALG